jgi:hypothetical protein
LDEAAVLAQVFGLAYGPILRRRSRGRIRSFALEARSLDAARMLEMEPHKRYRLNLHKGT